MKIDIGLFPSVKFQDKTYKTEIGKGLCPLVSIYKKLTSSNFVVNKIIVSGEGGIGKSTSLKCLLAYLLQEGQEVLFCNLKELNQGHTNILEQRMSNLPSLRNTIIILDSYDELDEVAKNYVDSKMEELQLGKCLFIGCREKYEGLRENFFDYSFAEFQPFNKEQVKNLLKKNNIELIEDSQLYELLNNTMLFSIFLQLKDKGINVAESIAEGELLRLYFTMLFKRKSSTENANTLQRQAEQELYHLGKRLYQQINVMCFILEGDLTWKNELLSVPDICREFNGIFEIKSMYSESRIEELWQEYETMISDLDYNVVAMYGGMSLEEIKREYLQQVNEAIQLIKIFDGVEFLSVSQEKYSHFLLAYYLKIELTNRLTQANCIKGLLRLCRVAIKNHSEELIEPFLPALLYCGQLLKADNDFEENKYFTQNLFSLLQNRVNDLYDKGKKRSNYILVSFILCLLSGYNNGIICSTEYFDWDTLKLFYGISLSDDMKVKEIVVPQGAQKLKQGCFSGCSSLSKVVIGPRTETIEAFADDTNLRDIVISDANKNYKTIDSSLYTKDGSVLVQAAIARSTDLFEVPYSVKIIGELACSNLKSQKVVLPNGLQSIKRWAFAHSDVTSVMLPKTLEHIGEYAFICSEIKEIIIPPLIQSIEESVFSNCKNLRQVTIGKEVSLIAEDAFADCDNLELAVFECIKGWYSDGEEVREEILNEPKLAARMLRERKLLKKI